MSDSTPLKIKQSIATITNGLLAVFVTVFVALTVFTYKQLKETEVSFETIAINVVPTLADNGILHSQVSSLAFLVGNFAQSTTPAQMRISRTEVINKLKEIKRLVASNSSDINAELILIQDEFEVLNGWLQEMFDLQQVLNESEQQIYVIQSQISGSDSSTRFAKAELLISTLRLINTGKLIDVRRLQRQMQDKIRSVADQSASESDALSVVSDKIDELIFGERGIIDTKLAMLRTKGRVEGQRNFVRRLVLDIANDTEFKAYSFAEQQSMQATELAGRSSDRFSITFFGYIASFATALSLIIFIKYRVVSRLRLLNASIASESLSDNTEILNRQNDEIAVLTGTIVKHIETIDQQKTELTQLSFLDGLTKIGNRRAFNERFKQATNLAMRNKLSLSVLFVDVDCFKQYNDEYGHIQGDECLIKVAQEIKEKAKRSSDFVARYGGEEFACLLIGVSNIEALDFARSLCVAIEALTIRHTASKAASDYVTVSVGVYTESMIDKNSEERLLHCADTALYQAKTQGRNCAVQYLGN